MNAHDRLVASTRVYRLIADPVMADDDGADPWVIGSVLDPEVPRDHVDRIIAALVAEGAVLQRDGRLFPAPYEREGGPSAVITIADLDDEGLDFKLEFEPPYNHHDLQANPGSHLAALHFMAWVKERMEAAGNVTVDLTDVNGEESG